MKSVSFLTLALLLYPLASWGADELKPLDVKPGLWETTVTSQMTGMPPIPPEALARLTPEQRARMEEMMKQRGAQGPRTTTSKSCATREDINKMSSVFNDNSARQNCKSTVTRSSSSEQDIRLDCSQNSIQATMNVHLQAVDSENVKGSMQINASGGDNKMNTQTSFTAKWLGPDCGELKKP